MGALALSAALCLACLAVGCGGSEVGVPRDRVPDVVVDLATSASQTFGEGAPEWAAYAPIAPADAKALLGDDPCRIWRGIRDASKLYLIVLKGGFDARGTTGVEPGPGPYLWLLAARIGTTWSGNGYAVGDSVPQVEAGRLKRFALSARANPGVWKVLTVADSVAWLYLVPFVLFVTAFLVWWKQGRRWPYACGVGLVLIAVGMQVARTMLAARGVSDGGFMAMKMSVLGAVVAVDVVATLVLALSWRRATGWDDAGVSSGPTGTWRTLSITALVGVAVLYLATAPLLFTTGE